LTLKDRIDHNFNFGAVSDTGLLTGIIQCVSIKKLTFVFFYIFQKK